jgi:hypothetical protein
MSYQSGKSESLPLNISTTQESVRGLSSEEPKSIFKSRDPQNVLANFINRGGTKVELKISTTEHKDSVPRLIRSGATLIEEFEKVVSIELVPSKPNPNNLDRENFNFDTLIFHASGQTVPFKRWILFLPNACVENEVSRQPDDSSACVWEKDTIWKSTIARNINLELEVTGFHDLKVEIEDSNGGLSIFKIYAPPALPQFRSLIGDFEDIVAVHVVGQRSDVNPCSTCDYKYKICYKKQFPKIILSNS